MGHLSNSHTEGVAYTVRTPFKAGGGGGHEKSERGCKRFHTCDFSILTPPPPPPTVINDWSLKSV